MRESVESRKEDLAEIVELYRCDRSFVKKHIDELTDDIATPGLLVRPEVADDLSVEDLKAENPKDKIQHYFRT